MPTDCLNCALFDCDSCDDGEYGCCCGRLRRCEVCGLLPAPGAAPVCFGDCDRDDEWEECSPHLWLDRPESDTHVCDICGVERSGPPPSTVEPADA